MKRKMTAAQEFEIMKLVFDKFLWFGFGMMIYGFYYLITLNSVNGMYYLIIGLALLLFLALNIRAEYQYMT